MFVAPSAGSERSDASCEILCGSVVCGAGFVVSAAECRPCLLSASARRTPAMANGPGTQDRIAAQRLARRVVAQWPLIALSAALTAAAGYGISSAQTKQYEAISTVQLSDVNLAAVFTSQNLQQQGFDAQTKAATNAELVTMPRVRELAAAIPGAGATADELDEAVKVTTKPGTTLLDIKARDEDPARAAAMANAMRVAFIRSQQAAATAQLDATRRRIRTELAALSPQQRAASAGQDLRSRLNQLDNVSLGTGAGVSTAQPAATPREPFAPLPRRDALLSLLVGGMVGLGAAALRARLDDRIRDEAELAEHWALPVLGVIPHAKSLPQGADLPPAALVEAFALARTNLRYLHDEGRSGPIIVTSSIAGEGKSTVAWNVALAAAMAGTRVLLVDADLRRPVLASRLGISSQRGFSDVLAGMAKPLEVVRRVRVPVPGAGEVGIDLIPAGFVPPSPIALLERDTTASILQRLSAHYELVLIDTPPATVVADAKVLLERAAGAIVVTRLGAVTASAYDRLRALLSGSAAPVLGTIITDSTFTSEGYGSYYESDQPVAVAEPVAVAAPEVVVEPVAVEPVVVVEPVAVEPPATPQPSAVVDSALAELAAGKPEIDEHKPAHPQVTVADHRVGEPRFVSRS
jgi:polysaccharide biosynthesis transport protein